ncbi:MAG: prenyltransferase [bacterium]
MTELAMGAKEVSRFSVKARIWWKAVRPFSFPLSAMPALMGAAFAWVKGYDFSLSLAILTLLGAVTVHAAANLLQDYFDYTGGIDKPGTLGGSGLLVAGILGPRAVFMGSIACFAIAALIAAPLIMHAGAALLWIVLAGFALGAGYAVPRLGLKYRAFGDVAVFLAFGAGITMGSCLIQSRTPDLSALACGIPFGFLVVAVLVANNMRDVKDDERARVGTLAVIMGERATRAFYMALVIAAYAFPIICVQMNMLNAGALFVLATLASMRNLLLFVWRAPEGDRDAMAIAVERTAKLALAWGIAMTAGMVGWRLITAGA